MEFISTPTKVGHSSFNLKDTFRRTKLTTTFILLLCTKLMFAQVVNCEGIVLKTNGNHNRCDIYNYPNLNDFTVAIKFRSDLDNHIGAEPRMLNLFNGGTRLEFGLENNYGGFGNFWIFDSASIGTRNWGVNLHDDTWHQMVYTKSGGQRHMYLDGVLIDSWTGSNVQFGGGVYIGSWYGSQAPWKGSLDDFISFDKALTAAEIEEMYCTDGTNVIAHLDFSNGIPNGNNTNNTTVPDVSGNGYDATLINFLLTGDESNYVCSTSGIIDTNCCEDLDNDGYYATWCGGNDCDDNDPSIYPGNEVSSVDQWIESIDLNGAIHSSGNSGGYGDYSTEPPFNLTVGASHPMDLNPGFNGSDERVYWRVYIDYNNNGEFEHGGERELQGTAIGSLSKDLIIANNATAGLTKMRIIMSKGGYKLPCDGDFDGEIEDYAVMLNVCDPLLDGGAIGGSQAICASANDPQLLTNELDASGGTGVVEYKWMMNTDYCELPEDGIDNGWEDIAGATGADYDPGPLSETTIFIRAARSAGCLEYIYSNMIEIVNTIDCVPDCQSTATPSPTMWIKRVKLGNMANNSVDDGGYGDYTSLTSTVTQGKKIPYQLRQGFSNGSSDMFWTVWVDWNQDGFYSDLCELMIQRTSNLTLNGKIDVPVDALPGNTTFRVAMSTLAYADPCSTGFDGEVEDYSMEVIEDLNAMFAFDNTDASQIYVGQQEPEETLELDTKTTSEVSKIEFYPNPASDQLNIIVTQRQIGSTLSIQNNVGQIVYQSELKDAGTVNIALSDYQFETGMYYVHLKGAENNIVSKVFVQQ